MRLGLLGAGVLLAGCGGSSGLPGGQAGIPGTELTNPATGMLFIVDENQSGSANDLRLAEMFWGRCVDIHQLVDDSTVFPQDVDPNPVFVDFVIAQGIQTNNVEYKLETNPITQRTRLVILANKDSADDNEVLRWRNLFNRTQTNFPFIQPKNDDGTSPEPFSFLARNSCLVLRFNDILDDDVDALTALPDTVRVLTGFPPQTPFGSRIFFDPNHGAIIGSTFHSSRILIDMAVSEREAANTPNADTNALGLPPSQSTSGQPNVSVRIPTVVDFSAGQFEILTNLSGRPLDFSTNGPRDIASPTAEIVRAMRAGNNTDTNNGFVRDDTSPSVLGGFSVNFDGAFEDPPGQRSDFRVNLTFLSTCEATARVGDLFQVNGVVLEVTELSIPPSMGQLLNVGCRAADPVPVGLSLTGPGDFFNRFDPALVDIPAGIVPACWVGFAPAPLALPDAGINPSAQVLLRFTEPMDPATLSTFENFLIVRGVAAVNPGPPGAEEFVIGSNLQSPGLQQFSFCPVLPLNHIAGIPDPYQVRLAGATDLAGNPLESDLPFADFSLDMAAPEDLNGGISLRFDSQDEIGTIDPVNPVPDYRGQILLNLAEGSISPRAAVFQSFAADRNAPVPALMTANPVGISDPLTPRGSKLQYLWRYFDFGFPLLDETKHNLDIIGLNWSPLAAQVISDFYESFELRLSHTGFLPDEGIAFPNAGLTGLLGAPAPFTDNILTDPLGPQLLVHPSSLGYLIEPSRLFQTPQGTVMLPYPLDPLGNSPQATTPPTFTWRDTAVLAVGGPNGVGVPTMVENMAGVLPGGTNDIGALAGFGQVPSIGLPLLVEARCFPSNNGLGLNSFDSSIAALGYTTPNFRAYSSGGIDSSGTPVDKNPNAENVPSGGFNPNSVPPGMPTMTTADNNFYIGQIDTVIRVSRAHTIWIDVGQAANFFLPTVSPTADEQPDGTQVILEFRGADTFSPPGNTSVAEDATNIGPYGELAEDTSGNGFPESPQSTNVTFHNNVVTWSEEISDIDGSRFFQIRFSFINNIRSGLTAELTAVGTPFRFQ